MLVWYPISSPKADLTLLSGAQYRTLRSLAPTSKHIRRRTPRRTRRDGGIESSKVERGSAHSQLRIPSGQRTKQRRAPRRGAASCRSCFCEGGPRSISIISGLISALPTKLLHPLLLCSRHAPTAQVGMGTGGRRPRSSLRVR